MSYTDIVKKHASELRWYYKNIDKVRQYKKKARRLRIEYIQDLKKVSCIDCGKKYPPYVMDFDHFEENSKTETINRLAGTRAGWEMLKKKLKSVK